MKKEKKINSKKEKYKKFTAGKDKRIQDINERVSKLQQTDNWELKMQNENTIDNFFKPKRIKKKEW